MLDELDETTLMHLWYHLIEFKLTVLVQRIEIAGMVRIPAIIFPDFRRNSAGIH